MSVIGWIIMLLSVGSVTGLLVWCSLRILYSDNVGKFVHVQDVPFIDLEQED